MDVQPAIEKVNEGSVKRFTLDALAAWESLNADNLKKFFRKSSSDRYFHLYSTNFHDWNGYKSYAQEFMNQHSALKIEVTALRLFQEGAVVYVAVSYELVESFKSGGQSSREGRYTGVLLPSGGSWQIVHEQWSLPVRAAGWENY